MDVDQLLMTTRSARKALGSKRAGRGRGDPGMLAHRNAGGQRVDLAELPLVGDLRPRTSGSNRRAVPRRVSGAGRRPVHLRAGERGHRGWTTHVVDRVAGAEPGEGTASSFRATSHTFRALREMTRSSPRPCMGRSSWQFGTFSSRCTAAATAPVSPPFTSHTKRQFAVCSEFPLPTYRAARFPSPDCGPT